MGSRDATDNRGWFPRLNQLFEWFSNLAYLNLLWIAFTILGLGVAGFAPATTALFAVIRQLLRDEGGAPSLTRSFIRYYRRDFLQANGLFYVLLAIGSILYVDIVALSNVSAPFASVLTYGVYAIGVAYALTVVFIFPVHAHYDHIWYKYLKQAFFVGLIRPLHALFIVVLAAGAYAVMLQYKMLLLFFGVSAPAFIIMGVAARVFDGIHRSAPERPAAY